MELSRRLAAVAGMVTKGNVVCDVGCDHGYVSIYLVQEGISPHVIAMDVREGPLSHAKEHIRMYGLCNYIETRLSDGVEKLEMGEADTLILAGMGGRLMEAIITRGIAKVEPVEHRLQLIRGNGGVTVIDEDMLKLMISNRSRTVVEGE